MDFKAFFETLLEIEDITKELPQEAFFPVWMTAFDEYCIGHNIDPVEKLTELITVQKAVNNELGE